jgi:tetratricopeptide (TPR) repeat protein
LWLIGNAAAPALREAAGGDDPELAIRARSLLDDLRMGISPDAPQVVIDSMRQYRGGDEEQRVRGLNALAKAGAVGRLPLLRLFLVERDGSHKQEVLSRIREVGFGNIARTALLAGEDFAAERLLSETAGEGLPQATDYAAFLLIHGGLEKKIAELETSANGPPNRQRDTLLACMYRSRGDLGASRRAAERSGDVALADTIAWRAGDRIPMANHTTANDDTARAIFTMGLHWLGKEHDALDAASDEAIKCVDLNPSQAALVANALYLIGRRQQALDVITRHGEPLDAFESLKDEGRFAEALQLADRLRPDLPKAHDVLIPAGADEVSDAQMRQAIEVQLASAELLAALGENVRARTLADIAEDAVERYVTRAEATAVPLYRVLMRSGMTEMERTIGRPDRAATALLAAEAEEQQAVDHVNISDDVVFGAFFPGRGAEAKAWWMVLAAKFSQEAPEVRLPRLRRIMDGPGKGADDNDLAAQLAGWAAEAPGRRTASEGAVGQLAAMAETLYRYGRIDDAEACLMAAAAGSYSSGQFERAAKAAFDRGDWTRAADFYSRALDRQPSAAGMFYLKGLALRHAGLTDEAAAIMTRATILPLADDRSRLALADAMRANSEPDAAGRQEELAVRSGRLGLLDGAEALSRWARHLAEAGNFHDAATALQRSELGVFAKEPAKAYVPATTAIAVTLQIWSARADLQAGDGASAAIHAQAALSARPMDVEVASELVAAFDAAGNKSQADAVFQQAWSSFESALGAFPRYAKGHSAAALLSARCGRRLDDGLARARRAVELDPQNAEFIANEAQVHFRRGEREAAVGKLRECVKLDPKSARYQVLLKEYSATQTSERGR